MAYGCGTEAGQIAVNRLARQSRPGIEPCIGDTDARGMLDRPMFTPPLRVGIWPQGGPDSNPFIQVFADAVRAEGACVVHVASPADCDPGSIDVLHVHWPELAFLARPAADAVRNTLRILRGIARLRRRGIPVVWMVHNLRPHDLTPKRRLLWAAYHRALSRLVSGALTLSPATIETVRTAFPPLRRKPMGGAWHPAYPNHALPDARASTRTALGLHGASRLYAFVGLVRPYKGVDSLIGAFRALPDGGARLLIAGRAQDESFGARIRALADGDPRITLDLRHLSAADYAAALRAADLAVTPFVSHLHSGSLIHALSEHCPVLTPASPFACGLRAAVGGDWVQTYAPPLTAGILRATRCPVAAPDLSGFTAGALAREALRIYAECAGGEKKGVFFF